MNNWRLLLVAVIAVLQPTGSYTESNLIDGHQECCDQRSNSVTQDTRFYGHYHKTNPEERRLSSRADIREERRYESRNDPITRSRDRLARERAVRSVSPKSIFGLSTETRFARDQERHHRSAEAKESSQIRQEQSRLSRKSISRDSVGQYEREMLVSKRTKMAQYQDDDTRTARVGNERLYRKSFDSRDVRTVRESKDHRRISDNRDSMTVLRRVRDNIIINSIRRDSRINTSKSGTGLQADNNRERRFLDRRARQNVDSDRRSRSLGSTMNTVNDRKEFMPSTDLRENRRSNFRMSSEQIYERTQRDQNRVSMDRTSTVRRESSDRISKDRRREFVKQIDRSRSEIKENHNRERIDERRQLRDENRLFREKSSMVRESRLGTAAKRNQARTQISKSNVRTDERREATRDMQLPQRSRDTTERRQHSRVERKLEATTRNDKLVRTDERRDERRQFLTRSLDRIRSSLVSRSTEHEYNSRISDRIPERNVRTQASQHQRDVRTVEILDERREQRYDNQMSRDRIIAMRLDSRDSSKRQIPHRTASFSRFEVNSPFERESRNKRDLRDNVRFDVNRRETEERRAFREQNFDRMARNSEHRYDDLTRISQFRERISVNERGSTVRADMRSERTDMRSKTRDISQFVSAPQLRDNTRKTLTRNTNDRLQGTRSLSDNGDERREVRERADRDENRPSHNRISMARPSIERIKDLRREVRVTKNSRIDAGNEVNRNRRHVMVQRLVVRGQHRESRSADRVSFKRQSRDIPAVPSEERRFQRASSHDEIRSDRLSRSRNDRRTNEREIRNNIRDVRTADRQESRRMINREFQPNRQNSNMERIDRRTDRANRDMRIEAKPSPSNTGFGKDVRTDTRRDAIDARFRNFEAKIREIEPVDETADNQNAMNWQMVIYTLQGAYLCGLLMQLLTEKSNKGKTRNFTWWAASSKDLVKVD